ncbi:MAG: SDR family NAD(P)-dependent oxidoreductase [Bacteroidales bacterium]|nr:SDR family NAD(P)-dependent oxidoreductase [Bacteroidales bacterium]MCF8404723.1 SDR family NAD(P)-dependent oxidoreductase [Bacteroidales bacterium]
MQKAIVIGATSGMGKELAIKLSNNGYKVGIVGRRGMLLQKMLDSNPNAFVAQTLDISDKETPYVLENLVRSLGGLDLLVITAGFGEPYERLNNHITQKIININVLGFTNVVDWGLNFFLNQGNGHFVSFSSVAGIRGNGIDPAYCASNSFQMNYLEGLRMSIHQTGLPVHVTDIRPGFVEKSTTGVETRFWVTSLEKATNQIYTAILREKRIVYVSPRWRVIAFLLKFIPTTLYVKLLSRYLVPVKMKPSKLVLKLKAPVV